MELATDKRAVKNIRRLESMVDMVEASQSKQTYGPLDLARISITARILITGRRCSGLQPEGTMRS
jgi:hypothetical protein